MATAAVGLVAWAMNWQAFYEEWLYELDASASSALVDLGEAQAAFVVGHRAGVRPGATWNEALERDLAAHVAQALGEGTWGRLRPLVRRAFMLAAGSPRPWS